MKSIETLQQRFDKVRHEPSDISEHTGILYDLACQCDHITEMGVRGGVSTTFLYHALTRAKRRSLYRRALICYDINDCECRKLFEQYNEIDWMPRFEFHQMDSRKANIERTQMLFIDTLHTYEQLKAELKLHAHKVSRWIVLHDTKTFGTSDEGNKPGPGLWPAVEEFLKQETFHVKLKDDNQNGLTVLERRIRREQILR